MISRNFRLRPRAVCAVALFSALGIVWTAHIRSAQAAPVAPDPTQLAFDKMVKPFFEQNCIVCHSTDTATAGIRVDQLDAAFEDRQIAAWQAIRKKLAEGTMPPEGMPQPTAAERQQMVDWITQSLEAARVRVAPKNGLVRRLTVAQYRNTLRELLKLDDDLTNGIPPDAISRDGFVNNQETLNLSTQLLESYLEIADDALGRAIVNPKSKPSIQDFKMELGTSVNPHPFPDMLVLGDASALLNNKDFMVTQPIPVKPFAFDPHPMRTKFRFIEGYEGNDTVRAWREYDSIYHSVYADMRGSNGYPKGVAYSLVPEGLLLRPAIPNDETFGGGDGTFGPKANFKISSRELPVDGRFRITVTAAKYNDGLMLDADTPAQKADVPGAVVVRNPATPQSINIPKAGIYQVDVYAPAAGAAGASGAQTTAAPVAPDSSHLSDGLVGSWPLNGNAGSAGHPEGAAKYDDTLMGKALSLSGENASLVIPRGDAMNVGEGDFTVALWIHPKELVECGILSLETAAGTHGWYLDMPDIRGTVRLQTSGPDDKFNGSVIARGRGTIRANAWLHVAVAVHRGQKNGTLIYLNGNPVAKGDIGAANLDNPKANLLLGRTPNGQQFLGDINDVRIYRRVLGEAEIRALVEPGKKILPPAPQGRGGAGGGGRGAQREVTLTLGGREFTGSPQAQGAFAAVRLEAGAMRMDAQTSDLKDADRVVLTPLAAGDDISRRFLAFEKRLPRLGVHIGFRRDCGSTFTQVGPPQTVGSDKLTSYVFEGAMRNYPSSEVDKDNVNYLQGVREIGVRSEYTDGRDMPRLLIKSVEFEGPFYDQWPPAPHKNIFIESTHKDDPAVYAQEVIRSFATRAYRRPATPAEITSLMAVYQRAAGSGHNLQDSVKDALEVVLTSPQFLFLVENSRTPQPEPLDNYELASKLSYFLWNGPPDRTTLNLAASGTLAKQLESEVDRMMKDAKFSRFIHEFTSQWLALDKFSVLEPDRKLFPLLNRDTRDQLHEEPIQFVEYLMRHNMPVRNLITSDFIMANETVAGYYGLGDKTESGFEFVPIKHERPELGGVLTEAAIMAGLSDGRESNPVKRGAWLARKIIAEPPADPPPNVPALKNDTAHTLRERIEQHRNQPGCVQCHSKIDPWGIAFEEFDAGGRLKQKPADAHSTLPDKTEVSGANDLKRYLADDRIDQVAFSVLRNMATYGTGRTLTYNELSFMKQDELKLKADGYRMQDMIRYVVNSKMFLEK